MSLALPRFRPDQWAIAKHPAQVKVVACGRRWGKSTLNYSVSMAMSAGGGKAAYIVPFYKNGRSLWRQCEKALAPLVKQKLVEINRSERTVIFNNGGFFGVYSAENETAIRGENFNLVVVDEAPYVPESAWTDAIWPTLADYGGSAILTGTPKGQNWFFYEFQRGMSLMNEEQASWNAPSSANPNPKIKAAFEKMKAKGITRTFRQEWLAEFVTDGGEVFTNVDAASTGIQGEPEDGATYVAGLDWGQSVDFTVLSIFDAETKRQVALYRFNGLDWTPQRKKIRDYCNYWGVQVLRPEWNSIGNPNIEELKKEFAEHGLGTTITKFVTTNETKASAVEALALATEMGTVVLLDDPVQKAELKSFGRERLPTGATRYGAPSGMHDDTVMATCIAYNACDYSGGLSWVNI